ncbi:protease complex subunit PrcB family protein [Flavobacterium sp.]
MIKRVSIVGIVLLLFSCSSTKTITTKKPLYEVLVTKNDGGANIKFYEIISEPKEINMLLGDEDLRKVIKKDDILTASYIIINLGPMPDGNYASTLEKVEETPSNILFKAKDLKTKEADPADESTVYPYSVVKINSKKPILLK